MTDLEPMDFPIQVLGKAVQVMDCFSIGTPVLHVSEVRRMTGLSTTTCARMLRFLVAADLLERSGDEDRTGLRVLARHTGAPGTVRRSAGCPARWRPRRHKGFRLAVGMRHKK